MNKPALRTSVAGRPADDAHLEEILGARDYERFVQSVAVIGALFARAGGRYQAYRVEGEGVTVTLKRTL